jgi:hypothetical protein
MSAPSINLVLKVKESPKNRLLTEIFEYFTSLGYRFAIAKTIESKDSFKVEDKPFEPKTVGLIVAPNESVDHPMYRDHYTSIVFCKSMTEVLAAGKEIRNTLITWTLDQLCDEK